MARHHCRDCGVDVVAAGDFCYIVDSLWSRIAAKDDDLCLRCIVRHIGRPLRAADFTDCFINRADWGVTSERMRAALERI